jgi:hypothetical protein
MEHGCGELSELLDILDMTITSILIDNIYISSVFSSLTNSLQVNVSVVVRRLLSTACSRSVFATLFGIHSRLLNETFLSLPSENEWISLAFLSPSLPPSFFVATKPATQPLVRTVE